MPALDVDNLVQVPGGCWWGAQPAQVPGNATSEIDYPSNRWGFGGQLGFGLM